MGPIADTDGGRVGLFGKRIGDVNGLHFISRCRRKVTGVYIRIIELGHLSQVVDYRILVRPRQTGWVVVWSILDVLGRILEDEISISLVFD
jgi:hypothetical protein